LEAHQGSKISKNSSLENEVDVDLASETVLQPEIVLPKPGNTLVGVVGHGYPATVLVGGFDQFSSHEAAIGRVVGNYLESPGGSQHVWQIWVESGFPAPDGNLVGRVLESLDHLLYQVVLPVLSILGAALVAVGAFEVALVRDGDVHHLRGGGAKTPMPVREL
jgi:hypothetical protein